jgi:hypothetical protein
MTKNEVTCNHRNPNDDRFYDQPCQLPAGHAYGHWYAPLVTQESVDRLQGRR